MQQLEIRYFFPLTEQIPLNLDYSPCEDYQRQKSNLVSLNTVSSYLVANGLTGSTTIFVKIVDSNLCETFNFISCSSS